MARSQPGTHSYDRGPTQTALPPCPPCPECDCCCEENDNYFSLGLFNNVAERVDLDPTWSEFEFEYTTKWSISFWVKYDNTIHASFSGVIAHRTSFLLGDANRWGWICLLHPSGSIRLLITTNTYGDGTNSNSRLLRSSGGATTLTDGEWHHVVFVNDGAAGPNSVNCFVDGALDNGANYGATNLTGTSISTPTNTRFTIGAGLTGVSTYAYPLDVNVDEFTMWAGALSPSDILFLGGQESVTGPLCAPKIPQEGDPSVSCPEGLMLWYRMGDDPLDKLVSTTSSPGPVNLQDKGPNARHGVPVGFPVTAQWFADAPVGCDCEQADPNTIEQMPPPDPRWSYLVAMPPERSTTSCYPQDWGLMVEPTQDYPIRT